jgi:FkbM family methyltransferase
MAKEQGNPMATAFLPLMANLHHKALLLAKQVVYGKRGEPYRISGQTLRFMPGTRPVRMHYANSSNGISRYDALQIQLFRDTLREGDTAVDIGAHAGQYCILMAALCGQSGQVVAFEPDPYARERLLQNLSLNPAIKRPLVESCAVSDTAGEAVLFSRGGNSQSSLALSGVEFSSEHKSEEIRVPLVSLDDYLLVKKLPQPRWVKIDAEGAEIRILKGGKRLLQSDAQIVCELHPYAWAEFDNTFAELKELMTSARRQMRYLDQNEMVCEAKYGAVVLERRP